MRQKAKWWEALEGAKVRCRLCPRGCVIAEGGRGFCFIRKNEGGKLISEAYGRISGMAADPIEKKPLFHFYPGSRVLSFGTIGCNLNCQCCQNWHISRAKDIRILREEVTPEAVVETAIKTGCKTVAFTYNEPLIFAEFAMDTARACREAGIKTAAVTAGYVNPEPGKEFFSLMDASNVDLKGFNEKFYLSHTGAHLKNILETLELIHRETSAWLELTTLLIPGKNDDLMEIKNMCEWIREHLGTDVPVHFSAFHPDYNMTEVPPTSLKTLNQAYEIGLSAGLKFVYTGNVWEKPRETTFCPSCKKPVIVRNGFEVERNELQNNRCGFCQAVIPGYFSS
ncbi:MAG: AmmeMemoRadiSam system radical SAM enzyme [Candidatus Aureabacteria bacterium]|nr:AmmeMemoRadiSam system radical SAM enzyme [Candidatus Auribacterota bacterium]